LQPVPDGKFVKFIKPRQSARYARSVQIAHIILKGSQQNLHSCQSRNARPFKWAGSTFRGVQNLFKADQIWSYESGHWPAIPSNFLPTELSDGKEIQRQLRYQYCTANKL